MFPQPPCKRRAAFTLVELLMAGTVTAMTAAAAAALLFAIANASQETRDRRLTVSAGHYLVGRIGESIREARAVGQVTATTITLWTTDTNANDQMDLAEVATIRYDSAAKQVIYDSVVSPTAPTTLVTYSTFTNFGALSGQMVAPYKQSVIWGNDIQSFALIGYPNLTDSRVVDVSFTICAGADQMAFRVSASPKASGDYLYLAGARGATISGRVSRKYYSIWDGFAAHPAGITMSYKTPVSGGGLAAP